MDGIAEQKAHIDHLVTQLNDASDAYYGGREEIMTNFEWDAGFDELSALEAETGYIRPDSPTRSTGHAARDDDGGADKPEGSGAREPHEYPALSLAKTKDVRQLQAFAENRPVWLSWKLDGLTLVLTYDGGSLTRILTRGNGATGTNITFFKEVIRGIPARIDEPGHLVVRGEATISYSDFEAVNDTLEDGDDKYANPRNLAAGTLALDPENAETVRQRGVTFRAFTLVHLDQPLDAWGGRMELLDRLGFLTVEREKTDAAGLPDAVSRWTRRVEEGRVDQPVDGLVVTYDDTGYAATGSVTGHHATRAGLAYKWQDTSAVTRLHHIEWSCAASTITPVAVFDPVLLEGTTVSRASLCNISELMRLGVGSDGKTMLEIIKANKIIPKCIAVREAEGCFAVPSRCPVCEAAAAIRRSEHSGTLTLRCTNPDCPAKHLKRFARFVSKTGMDIDGLSVQTLLTFVNHGLIAAFQDIYRLPEHREEIAALDGFGDKSCDNLLRAIEKSRDAQPVHFLYALCIPMIGLDAGKKIVARLGRDEMLRRLAGGEGFEDIDGIGPEKSGAITVWIADGRNRETLRALLEEVQLENVLPQAPSGGRCAGLTFVITGEVAHFANRDAFKAYVEAEGGKVTGSVSKKTDYLVNNDTASASAKNRKAQELRIPILSEEAFLLQFGGDFSADA